MFGSVLFVSFSIHYCMEHPVLQEDHMSLPMRVVFHSTISQPHRSRLAHLVHLSTLFLDNGKIVLIPILALKEATTIMALPSIKVATKYNH
jgi:hypothetical protein